MIAVALVAVVGLFGPGLLSSQAEAASRVCSQRNPEWSRFSIEWRALPHPGWYCLEGEQPPAERLGWWLR